MPDSVPLLLPDERALLVKLIDTTHTLAARIEQRLPRSLRAEHWQLDKHSPAPWQTLYWKHIQHVDPNVRECLSLRANLADIAAILHASSHQLGEAEKTAAPNLTLATVKRVTL
jgi:hypothetical protein